MPHHWGGATESFKKLYLRGGICDMVFPSDDMGDAVVNIINYRRQRINHSPVFTNQDRV